MLTNRADLFNEAERIRDRLAEIRNDIGAIDRTLSVLDYKGDLDAAMPRQKREVIFGRGELTRAIIEELRINSEPLTTREIAQAIVSLRGDDARDRRYVSDLVKRVGKALRHLHGENRARRQVDKNGNLVWSLTGL